MKENVWPDGSPSSSSDEPTWPCLYPDDLLSGNRQFDQAGSGDANWWMVYTKSRQEKSLAKQLFSRGVPFYLPLIKRRSLSRGRARISIVPLFTGYLFLYGTGAERLVALETNRVSSAVRVAEEGGLQEDLLRVADLIAKDAPLTPESRLVAGQRVRVKSGPFVGHEGVVFQRHGKTRLMVIVNFMQQGVSMAIDDCYLEPYEWSNTTTNGRATTLSVNWVLDRRVRTSNQPRLKRCGA